MDSSYYMENSNSFITPLKYYMNYIKKVLQNIILCYNCINKIGIGECFNVEVFINYSKYN